MANKGKQSGVSEYIVIPDGGADGGADESGECEEKELLLSSECTETTYVNVRRPKSWVAGAGQVGLGGGCYD